MKPLTLTLSILVFLGFGWIIYIAFPVQPCTVAFSLPFPMDSLASASIDAPFRVQTTGRGKVYYVGPDGTDTSPGTLELPFGTLSHAARSVQPGDTVWVLDGVYQGAVKIESVGKADDWIVFRSRSPQGAKITTTGHDYAVSILDAAYIEFSGFEVYQTGEKPTGYGIMANGGHHIRITENHVHHCGGNGISANFGDYRLIERNVVHHNAYWDTNQTSGISLWQPAALDTAPGYHLIIRGNTCYANQCKVGNKDGVITDGNGIILDDFFNTQMESTRGRYPAATLVENNICFSNGLRGIQVFLSQNINVRNNTLFWNNTSPGDGSESRAEAGNIYSSHVIWTNNICWANAKDNPRNLAILDMGWEEAEDTSAFRNIGVSWFHNITYNGTPGKAAIQLLNTASCLSEAQGNLLGIHPGIQFDEASLPPSPVYTFLEGSPVLNAGLMTHFAPADFIGRTRPLGSAPDMGAIEASQSH
jgi:parallel beta-helix repeat protein